MKRKLGTPRPKEDYRGFRRNAARKEKNIWRRAEARQRWKALQL